MNFQDLQNWAKLYNVPLQEPRRKKITALTKSETALVEPWRDMWIAIGASPGETHKEDFEEAIKACYSYAQYAPPKEVVWFASPIKMLRYALERSIEEEKIPQDQRAAYMRNNWARYFGGHCWVSWQAHESFMIEVLGLKLPGDLVERARIYRQAQTSAGWWWAGDTFVAVSERHVVGNIWTRSRRPVAECVSSQPYQTRFTRQGPVPTTVVDSRRLKPALEWSDGFTINRVNGITVPEDWITTPEKLDPRMVLTERNLDRRMAIVRILGWDKILPALKTRVIDKDEPHIGTLVEVDLPNAPSTRFLQVQGPGNQGPDGTYVLIVDNKHKTALEANAATYNMDPAKLLKAVRT